MIILGTNSIKDTGYNVANSVRYNDGDSPKLNIDFSSDGTLNKWTFSMWFKRSTLGTAQRLFCVIDSGMDDYIKFGTDDQLEWVFDNEDGSNKGVLKTNRKFRDVSAWYHLVCRLDTTDSTAGDRMRMYINGTEETSFATDTNPTLNETGDIGRDNNHYIGTSGSSQYFDGYIAEVCMINNQSLAPTSFGEYDEDSPTIWKPIDVSGLTAGTNGFYLDFEDSGNLGNDAFGGTDWTETNLAATDQSTDTCTNNFCTLNPLGGKRGNNTTFSEGNLKSVDTGSTNGVDPNLHATFGLTAGSWYFEMKAEAITAGRMASIALLVQDGQGPDDYADARTVNLYYEKNSSGNKIRKFSSDVETGLADNAADDIFGVALDIDNGTVQFYKNGSTYGSQVTGLSSSGKTTFISMLGEGGSGRAATCNLNFGSPAFAISSGNADGNGYGNFEYAVPSGFLALCTKNLGSDGG